MENQEMKAASEPEARRAGGAEAALARSKTEVPAIPKRRRFTAEYKRQILKELDHCREPGQKGLILRREGLYSSTVAHWRKRRQQMANPKKTSQSNTLKNENARLQRRVTSLEAQLDRANKLIEIQKKMADFAENLRFESSEGNPSE